MADFFVTVITLLFFVVVVLMVTALVVAGFISVGALFARFTELTLFQATILTVPVGAAALYLLGRIMELPVTGQEEEEWDDWEDWDDDLDFEDLSPEERQKLLWLVAQWLEEELGAEEAMFESPPPRKRRRR